MAFVRIFFHHIYLDFGQSTKQTCIQCMIKRKSFLRKEEYKIQITTHKVRKFSVIYVK